jgi:homocysteine S-methyltransferase
MMRTLRRNLPQLSGTPLLTDGGLETTLIFHNGLELPHFAAFTLLRRAEGREMIRQYYLPYIETARANGFGFLLESVTWRASRDWGEKLGYTAEELADANRQSIALLLELRASYERANFPMIVSGAIGPRGDGYVAGEMMSNAEAEDYHCEQIATLAGTRADMIGAYTMTNAAEAIGIVRAAQTYAIPVAVSFTTETDGNLPTGQRLADAIAEVDAATSAAPVYYMINCAHPTHFDHTLSGNDGWTGRLRGIRANASTRSHAELNEATELDAGDPQDLGRRYRALRARYPQLTVLGGCCGTDHRHVACIAHDCRIDAAA